jgi:hypothetical protein
MDSGGVFAPHFRRHSQSPQCSAAFTKARGANCRSWVKATTTPAPALPEVERRIVNLIALATLIVSIPSAALAVWDIVDRIRKRRKAPAVIDTAQRLRSERHVETYLLAADQTPRAVADLDADKLLDLVVEIDRPAH